MNERVWRLLLLANTFCYGVELKTALAHIFNFLILIGERGDHEQTAFRTGLDIARLWFEIGWEAFEKKYDQWDVCLHGSSSNLLLRFPMACIGRPATWMVPRLVKKFGWCLLMSRRRGLSSR